MSSERPPRGSRYYRRRRSISWTGLLLGFFIGIGGGLYWAWQVAPLEETDTAPWQLNAGNRADYLVGIMLAYSNDGDLGRAVTRLLELKPQGDPIQYVALVACDLARSGYVDSASGERAIRAMMSFYGNQGRSGCADTLLPPVTAPTVMPTAGPGTPTLPPPPTKTHTPTFEPQAATPTPQILVPPTVVPQSSFEIVRLEEFCDADFGGLIEVYVQMRDGSGIAGQRVRVAWRDGQSNFVTGLLAGQGSDYADFSMTTGIGYTVEMPGLSDPSRQLVSDSCVDLTGQRTQRSFRIVFRPSF